MIVLQVLVAPVSRLQPNDLDMNIQEYAHIVEESDLFDASWYREEYRDVSILGADPVQHFLRWGGLLRRAPGPGFDTGFYLDRYTDAAASNLNPLVHYLLHGVKDNRPVSAEQLQAQMDDLRRETEAKWRVSDITSSRATRPIISYCIPLMGRLADIQQTLARNLTEVMPLRDKVEFLIILFGDSAEALKWIEGHFQSSLSDGFLRVVSDDTLDSWHFSKAKNAFRAHMLGDIYSSLDGDNFVTLDETQALIEVYETYQGHFLLHHFSGEWGDGSSGRVSLPAAAYRAVGYNPRLLPRQYDEMDMILATLQRFPAMPYLCLDPERNIFRKSTYSRTFFEQEGLPNSLAQVRDYERHAPANPRGEGYTNQMPYLKVMGNFNAAYSGYLHSRDPMRKEGYLGQVVQERHRLIDTLPRQAMLDMFFTVQGRPALGLRPKGEVSLLICVRNEGHFLSALLRHYRALGVGSFFIVDDGSDVPVETLICDNDVYVFHPKVGDFRTCKGLWLEALAAVHLPEGNWCLTVDADEFIHLPKDYIDFPALAKDLDARGQEYATGLMLDLVPAPDTPAVRFDDAEMYFSELFNHCCNIEAPAAPDYATHRSIAWGFGPFAALSWRVDARYHAFGTFDSLRKIPFLKLRPGRHLNQGFHSLHYTDGTPAPGTDIWNTRPILPVFHYKLVKLFSDTARARMLGQAANYHQRTGDNIREMFADGSAVERLMHRLANRTVPVGEIVHDLDRLARRAAE